MKFSSIIAASIASTAVLALPVAESSPAELFTIELAPEVTKQVTEAEKWELRKAGKNFIDVTDFSELSSTPTLIRRAPVYPAAVAQKAAVTPLTAKLSAANIKSTLTTFVTYNNRYYKSTTGAQSSAWLLSQAQSIISAAGTSNVTARAFTHSWGQPSVIVTIPGKSAKIVAIGAHQDSINLNSPSAGRAPGADDDGSGSMTILEALRVLLTSSTVRTGQLANTIEFHWYAAEEAGLLGSQAIFTNYKNAGKNVVAMLQQDMTGYIQGSLSAGRPEAIGLVTDYVDTTLTAFVRKVIAAYCAIPSVNTQCGYACSDHASANKAGYPSSFVFESTFDDSNPYIHTASDTIDRLSFSHMVEHAKMTVGFAYELGAATL